MFDALLLKNYVSPYKNFPLIFTSLSILKLKFSRKAKKSSAYRELTGLELNKLNFDLVVKTDRLTKVHISNIQDSCK